MISPVITYRWTRNRAGISSDLILSPISGGNIAGVHPGAHGYRCRLHQHQRKPVRPRRRLVPACGGVPAWRRHHGTRGEPGGLRPQLPDECGHLTRVQDCGQGRFGLRNGVSDTVPCLGSGVRHFVGTESGPGFGKLAIRIGHSALSVARVDTHWTLGGVCLSLSSDSRLHALTRIGNSRYPLARVDTHWTPGFRRHTRLTSQYE